MTDGGQGRRGFFLTFEGVEGCGKTTQIALIEAHLKSRGIGTLRTREPGGTPIAEAIRVILLDPAHTSMAPVTELLLYGAARAQHVWERIAPALEAGTTVLCDRFADSTTAYQMAGRGLPREMVTRLHEIATAGTRPDLTVLIDLPVETGLARATRTSADRMERETLDFHRRVRQAFLDLAAAESDRVKVVDGSRCIDAVAEDVRRAVDMLWE